EVAKLSGSAKGSSLAAAYVASKDGKVVGTAYFDTHVVRTLAETLMVVVSPAATIARIEVLSFSEPEEFLPREHWYEQFPGRSLDDELSVKRGIRPVSGATLTAGATTEAARRVAALPQVGAGRSGKPPCTDGRRGSSAAGSASPPRAGSSTGSRSTSSPIRTRTPARGIRGSPCSSPRTSSRPRPRCSRWGCSCGAMSCRGSGGGSARAGGPA